MVMKPEEITKNREFFLFDNFLFYNVSNEENLSELK